jgi:hypothetical protein
MSTPAPTVTRSVATTMMLTALRTDAGSCRNLDMRRSMTFGHATCPTVLIAADAHFTPGG